MRRSRGSSLGRKGDGTLAYAVYSYYITRGVKFIYIYARGI